MGGFGTENPIIVIELLQPETQIGDIIKLLHFEELLSIP